MEAKMTEHWRTDLRGLSVIVASLQFLAPAVTVGETEGAMDSASVFFLPLLLPITL